MRRRHLENVVYDPNWQSPGVIYGDDLISKVAQASEKYAVATMEIPWNLVKDKLTRQPKKVVFVPNMHKETVEKLETSVPQVDLVIGIGGGSSHDMAKYIALKKQCRLIQVPTILSSDACVTRAVGIRENGKVKYIGHVFIDQIVVDFSLLKRAPKELIRLGAGDILSSHTALYDWKVSVRSGFEKMNAHAYKEAKEFLSRLKKNRYEIRDATEKGIKTILELYLEYARLANQIGTDRAQEGSEHFFAYGVEYLTKRQFVHGQLLVTGIAVMSYLQDNDFEETLELMEDMGIGYRLQKIGLTKDTFAEVLLSLKEFVEKGGYYYSIVNEKKINSTLIQDVFERLS